MTFFKKLLIFFFSLVLLLQFNFVYAKETKLQVQTIDYASGLQADLYRMDSKKKVPAVILVHGGYWYRGKREELSDFAIKLANDDYLAMMTIICCRNMDKKLKQMI